jgi:hypothetical protein
MSRQIGKQWLAVLLTVILSSCVSEHQHKFIDYDLLPPDWAQEDATIDLVTDVPVDMFDVLTDETAPTDILPDETPLPDILPDETTLPDILPDEVTPDLVDVHEVEAEICASKTCEDDYPGDCGLQDDGCGSELDCGCCPDCEGKDCGSDGCEGSCWSGEEQECDDGNPCTIDSCETGNCDHQLKELEELIIEECLCETIAECEPLEDNDLCNGTLICDTEADIPTCMVDPETVKVCDDGNPCTANTCNPETGCEAENLTIECDDSSDCTFNDTCAEGACVGTGYDCDDLLDCTADSCDGIGTCGHEVLADWCVIDSTCIGALEIQPENECQACHPGTDNAAYTPVLDETGCDDGSKCTDNDVCTTGVCAGSQVVCDDAEVCTEDSCTNPEIGCQYEPVAGNCDDLSDCTDSDHCESGFCVGTLIDCNDNNPCTGDSCLSDGGCQYENLTSGCDDSNPCTENDTCTGGLCEGKQVICNDSNPCTDDVCLPAEGGCQYTNNVLDCDDGNTCTENDICSESICSGTPIDCNDDNPCTLDKCENGICLTEGTPDLEGTSCGDYLNGAKICQSGTCAVACDQGWADINGLDEDGCEATYADELWVDASNNDPGENGTKDNPYSTIQVALNVALETGVLIHVAPGMYYGALTIQTDNILLLGDSKDEVILNAPAEFPGILIQDADNIGISGLTIVGGWNTVHVQGMPGAELSNINLANLNVQDNHPPESQSVAGILVRYTQGMQITNITISGIIGIDAPTPIEKGSNVRGIHLYEVSDVVMSDIAISGVHSGHGGDAVAPGDSGSAGGTACGFFLHATENITITDTEISLIEGGEAGDAGADGGQGSEGGGAAGVRVSGCTNCQISNIIVHHIFSGRGGEALNGSTGGKAGDASYVYLDNCSDCAIDQWHGTNVKAASPGNKGQPTMGWGGEANGVYFKDSSKLSLSHLLLANIDVGAATGGATATGIKLSSVTGATVISFVSLQGIGESSGAGFGVRIEATQVDPIEVFNSILSDVNGTCLWSTDTNQSTILTAAYSALNNCSAATTSNAQIKPGSILVDPLFVKVGAYDFALQPESPCIDTGMPGTECLNEPVPNGCRVNMGAYGNTVLATSAPDSSNCEDCGECPTTCATDPDCCSTDFCQGAGCQAKKDNDQGCADNKECLSGNCVIGICSD